MVSIDPTLDGMSYPDDRVRVFMTHRFGRLCVWLAVTLGAIVIWEPAPVDALNIGLIVLLPIIGLTRFTPSIIGLLGLWLVIAAAGLIASIVSPVMAKSIGHTFVTLYLSFFCVVLAAFVARSPHRHASLILNAYLVGAVIAALAALAGYFSLTGWAYDLFTRYGRAAGTFKDPNVLGPYLVLGALYVLHLVLIRRPQIVAFAGAMGLLLVLVILLTFSRGAWLNLAVGLIVFGGISVITARSNIERLRLCFLAVLAFVLMIGVVVVAAQSEKTGSLLSERSSLSQSHDAGPDGRFGGQKKAALLALHNPLGLGARAFRKGGYHHEYPHNVYISMFLNAGWLGGSFYLCVIMCTLLLGLRGSLRPTRAQPLLIVAYAAFVGHAAQGLIIDTDHWRHIFLLISIIWGLSDVPAQLTNKFGRRRGRASSRLGGTQFAE